MIKKYPLYFLLPAFAVFAVFFITPTITGVYYSFTNWNVNSPIIKFTGIDNYVRMWSEPRIHLAFRNTFIFAFAVTILQTSIGLILALMMHEKLYTRNILRTIFFAPYVIATLIIGYIFKVLYHPDKGIVNHTLDGLGLGFLSHDWLHDPNVALLAIILTDVWKSIGFVMVIFLAGLQFIPKDILESANIDGANYWHRFRHVTFPLLAPSFTVNVLLSIIGSLKVFEIVIVLTGGGPGYRTEVFNTYVMRAFSQGEFGYATAINMLLFLVVTGVGVPVLYWLRKREVEL